MKRIVELMLKRIMNIYYMWETNPIWFRTFTWLVVGFVLGAIEVQVTQ